MFIILMAWLLGVFCWPREEPMQSLFLLESMEERVFVRMLARVLARCIWILQAGIHSDTCREHMVCMIEI